MNVIVLARQENPQCFLLTKAILLATIGPPRKGECKGQSVLLVCNMEPTWGQICDSLTARVLSSTLVKYCFTFYSIVS